MVELTSFIEGLHSGKKGLRLLLTVFLGDRDTGNAGGLWREKG